MYIVAILYCFKKRQEKHLYVQYTYFFSEYFLRLVDVELLDTESCLIFWFCFFFFFP
jgi:hypothetical protein